MSGGLRVGDKFSPEGLTAALRLAGLTLSLAAIVVTLGPVARLGRGRGWRLARSAPVLFQRILCAGLGVRVRQYGALSPVGRQLIVANHVSWLDIPALASLAPMSFLAKKEVGGNPAARELVALQGVVYVDRQRRACIPEVNAQMVETMRRGSPVVLFAEATTGDGNRLRRFCSSHFEAIRQAAAADAPDEAVIQPVYLDYSRLAGLPLARDDRPRIAWYGDMTFFDHLFRFVRAGGATCDVYFGVPIPVGPGLNRKIAARLTEAAIRELARKARAPQGHPIFPEPESAYISLSPFRSP